MSNLTDLLQALKDCLCEQIRADGLPDVCFCGLVPGELVAFDYAGDCSDACGMAWVRFASLYPSDTVGEINSIPGNCSSGLGAEIEVGIMRCTSVGDENGEPPTPQELLESTTLQAMDALAMRTAIMCCSALPRTDYILSTYQPLGPAGGLVGGMWGISVGLV